MKSARLLLLVSFAAASLFAQSHPDVPTGPREAAESSATSQPRPAIRARLVENSGRLPLAFEANQGQVDPQVKFLSRSSGYNLFLTPTEAVLTLNRTSPHALASQQGKPSVLRMKLVGANASAQIFGQDELEGKSNYFVGNDPAKWHKNVSTYAKVKYKGIYPGIDLVYYGNQRHLEYDFIVAPGADPRRIEFDINGAKRTRQNAQGELVFTMREDEIRWHKPVVYQEKNGIRQLIAARYAISDKNRVGFKVAPYDSRRPLYIDPLVYSTYLGGTGYDAGSGIAVDSAGNTYVVGTTSSTGFPTASPLQAENAGFYDVFVAKINATGSALIYSTYLGGTGYDYGSGIAVDNVGDAYIVGWTYSTDFPVQNPLQPNNSGGPTDAFVAKLNPEGSSLVYSTYLGGTASDAATSIALDSAGSAYITGTTTSTDFPTHHPLQPAIAGPGNAFVAKINAAGSALAYSTYLGGSGANGDQGNGIAVDSAGSAYVTGSTSSSDFPTKNALQPAFGGGDYPCVCDAFVSKINPAGSALVYSTYLGGSGPDVGSGIAVDSAGNAYVTGDTNSKTDFPITPGAFQTTTQGFGAFVTKLNPQGSGLVYSTYLGEFLFYQDNNTMTGGGIAVDSAGNAYVTGATLSRFFPLVNPFQKQNRGNRGYDVFVSKFNPNGSSLFFSSFLGGRFYDSGSGIAIDSSGNAYVTGWTSSAFNLLHPLQPNYGGGPTDAFVSKIDVRGPTKITVSSSLNPSVAGQAVTFTAVVNSVAGTPADGEAVTFMADKKLLGTGTLSAGSASVTTSGLKPGAHVLRAVYGGDYNFSGSTSKVFKQAVNKAAN